MTSRDRQATILCRVSPVDIVIVFHIADMEIGNIVAAQNPNTASIFSDSSFALF